MKTHSNPLVTNRTQPNPVGQPVKPNQAQQDLIKPSQTHYNPLQLNKNPAKPIKTE